MRTFSTALRTICVILGVIFGIQHTSALPPTGLTQIRITPDTTADLAVIDGVAYASSSDGVYLIGVTGVESLVVPSIPSLSPLFDTTRVVQEDGGDIYYLADFDESGSVPGVSVALFNLNDAQSPEETWNRDFTLVGLDANLRGLAYSTQFSPFELFPNGDARIITVGPPADAFYPTDLTPSGTAVGDAVHTGTLGSGPALLRPNGDVEFLFVTGGITDIRDRADENGVNASYVDTFHSIVYGDSPAIDIDRSIGVTADFTGKVQVSETEFAVVEVWGGPGTPIREFDEFRAYFPGINPAGMDLTVSLFDVFPELNALDFNRVLDIASSEGQIHMLLSGDDGLWLFAAPDPSLIPEPSGFILIGVICLLLCGSKNGS